MAPSRQVQRTRISPLSLQLFVSVIEVGAIAAVADQHNLATSAVSKRLSDLEAALGVSLLRRTNRGIAPSPAGLALASLARNVLGDLDAIYARMQEFSAGVRGEVRLTANRSSIIGYLPTELQEFSSVYPNVVVRLEEQVSPQIVQSLLENEADIGLFWPGRQAVPFETAAYHVDQSVIIASPDHPLAGRLSVTFEETLNERFVGLHDEAVTQLHNLAATLRREVLVRIQVSSFDAMCAMVASGLGIGLLPRSCVPVELIDRKLKVVELNETWARRELRIGIRSYESLSAAARQLFDHLARRRPPA